MEEGAAGAVEVATEVEEEVATVGEEAAAAATVGEEEAALAEEEGVVEADSAAEVEEASIEDMIRGLLKG